MHTVLNKSERKQVLVKTKGTRMNGYTSVLDSKPTHKEEHKDGQEAYSTRSSALWLAPGYILAALLFDGALDSTVRILA